MFPIEDNEISILYEIRGLNSEGQDYFILDDDKFSLLKKEKEILLCDGYEFKIEDMIDDMVPDNKN